MSTFISGHLDKAGHDHGAAMGLGGRNSIPSKIFLFATSSTLTAAEPGTCAIGTGESFCGVKLPEHEREHLAYLHLLPRLRMSGTLPPLTQ
jgi:hypothetical protein